MTSLREVRSALAALGVVPRKKRGQNFLFEKGAVQKILAFAAAGPNDDVCEVGPGLGAITARLSADARTFCAVDIEPKFIEFLRASIPAIPPERFICADIRDVDLQTLGFSRSRPATVVSNVPYSLSSEFVLWLVGQSERISRASLLLQREFAERVAAEPGGKDYGTLSVWCSLVADMRLGPKIPGTCFFPPAEVESRLVELKMLPAPRFPVADLAQFEKTLRAGFSKRRKTLLNALHSSEHFGEKAAIEAALEKIGIDPGRRAETLSVEEFVRMSDALAA